MKPTKIKIRSRYLGYPYNGECAYPDQSFSLSDKNKRVIKVVSFALVTGLLAPYVLSQMIPGLKASVYACAAELADNTGKTMIKKGKQETSNSLIAGKHERAFLIGVSTAIGLAIVGLAYYLKEHPDALDYLW